MAEKTQPQKEKTLTQQLTDAAAKALTKPLQAFAKWGSEKPWRAVVVVVVLAAAGGTAEHYLGVGNAVSEQIEKVEAAASADPSGTTVVPPATIEP